MKPKKGISYTARYGKISKGKISPQLIRKRAIEKVKEFNKNFVRFDFKKIKRKRSDKNVL